METEELIRAIYLTLLHSMWQGAATAGIAGLILMNTKKLSSAWRYNFLAGSMLFFVLCALGTFFRMINLPIETPAGNDGGLAYASPIQLRVPSNMVDQAFTLLSSYSNSIVLVWFIIICLKGIHLAFGLQRISDLKTRRISDPGTNWTSLISTLSQRMGVKTIVRFAESGLTSIPLTVGYFKPVILVPLGMLAAIPTEQVEAIILHELAHIKRQDYFINIFQSLVEVLFFFNPAIWWLSGHLRAERENCCDDLAIANSSSKTEYVRALITFEEYRTQHPQLSIAFAGSENTLLKRTKRIIYNQNDTLNSMEKFILTSGLVVSGLLSLAFTDGAKEQISKTFKPAVSTISRPFPTVEKAFALFADTIPASGIREISINNGGSTTFNALHNGKTYKIVMKDDEVTDLYVAIDTLVPGSPAAPAAPVAPMTLPTKPAPPTPPMAPEAEGKAIKAIKVKPAKAIKREAAPAIETDAKPAIKPVMRISPKLSPPLEVHETPAPKPAAQGGSPMGYVPKLKGTSSMTYSGNSNVLKKNSTNDFAGQVKKELVAEGLVKDPKKFSYKISNNELIVDGVKQSKELHRRVISKVLKNKNQNIDFTYKKN